MRKYNKEDLILDGTRMNIGSYFKRILLKTEGLQRFSWLLFNSIFASAVDFLVSVFFARRFTTEIVGQYGYASAVVSIFLPISLMGIEQIVVKDLGQRKEDAGEVMGSAHILILIGSILSFITILFIALMPHSTLGRRIFLVVLAIPVLLRPLEVDRFWILGQGDVSRYAIVQTLIKGIFFALKCGIIAIGHEYLFAMCTVFEAVMTVTGYFFLADKEKNRKKKKRINTCKIKWLLKKGGPLLLSSCFVVIYMRIDQVMVGNLLGDSQLGIYSVAVKISEAWYVIPGVLMNAYLPLIANAYCSDNQLFSFLFQRLSDYLGLVGYGALAIIMILGEPIILMLYGPMYAYAETIIKCYAWAGIAVSINYSLTVAFAIKEWSWLSMLITVIGALTNIILNIVLIPRMGSVGAAAATVVSYWTSDVVLPLILCIKVRDMRTYVKIMLKGLFPFVRIGKLICNIYEQE